MRSRVWLIVCFIVILTSSAGWAAATPQGKMVTYHEGVSGYLAAPADAKSAPALILIHEWWGLNDNIKALARQFAALGYVALAVDLYQGQSTQDPAQARQLAGSVRNNMPAAFDNLKAALAYLKKDTHVDATRLAAIGWCFGGGWAYQMAKNDLGVKASIIYYGRFNPQDDLKKMRARLLGHFGAADRAIKVDTVKEFQARLKTLGGAHEIYIYENAGHGFANEVGANYHKKAAQQAWERTVKFLGQVLGP